MFKKKPTIKPLAPLRSSDRRKLADQIIKDYALDPATAASPPHPDQTAEQKAEATAARAALRNALLPDNAQSARFTTTAGPDLKQVSGTVYVGHHAPGEEARILWFEDEGRYYPTVYTLWRNPDIVPLLHTPEIVVKKLQGGADLMTPGLAGGPPFPEGAKKGKVVAVASTEAPSVPVMVGWCEIDVSALGMVQGTKGHAVRSMHWCGDEAWGFGGSGKAGVKASEELEGWKRVLEARGLAEKVAGLDMGDHDVEDEGGGVALSNGASDGPQNGRAETTDAEDTSEPHHPPLTQKEIDTAFRSAFLYGLHKHKTSNPTTPNYGLIFPLTQSYVMSQLIQPYLPAFTQVQKDQLQIKKTSWKNIKKFIKSLDKEQIIKSKEQSGNETVILDVDFDDRAITDFKPYRLPKIEAPASGAAQGRESSKAADAGGDESVGQKLQVLSLYKATSKLQPLFESSTTAALAVKQLHTPTEVRAIVTTYLESEALISATNKRLITLNPILANNVFDGSSPLDKEVIAKGAVPRDALIERVLASMSPYYTISRNNDDSQDKPKSGSPPKVHITMETRSGNKVVTKVSGLEVYFISPKLLADELRKVCAGSTSVEQLVGATKKTEKPIEEVMVQGPQKDAVVKALERRGVSVKWIDVQDKTKKGKGRT